MSWTAYHDSLVQEQIALMAEPDWPSKPEIVNRLNTIRTELQTASSGLDQVTDPTTQQQVTQQQLLDRILGDFQSAYDSGVTANESRYQELKSGYDQRTTDLQAMLQGYGDVQRQDVQDRYAALGGKMEQNLASRGLGNTTVRNSALQGLNRAQTADNARVEDSIRNTSLQYMTDWTREPLGVIERRTDTYPSLADVANMAQQVGRSQSSMYALPGFNPLTTYGSGSGLSGLFG